MSLIVVGGYYREVCSAPRRDEKYGSGGRAALAIALAECSVDWYYYCPEKHQQEARIALSHQHLTHKPHGSDNQIKFEYFHPLSTPRYYPSISEPHDPIEVTGTNILRFGFMEGTGIVHGQKVVFDPQSPNSPSFFGANGSTASSLAIVLNQHEVLALGGGEDELEAVRAVSKKDHAEVVLVKSGAEGCRVYVGGELAGVVPPYYTDQVYKIGSGDVFSASFAYHWAELGAAPVDAADAASRCVAQYVSTCVPAVALRPEAESLRGLKVMNENAQVYIAGPFFTMAELWLIEEACRAFHSLGVKFFSPYHEAGLLGKYEDTTAHRDRLAAVVENDLKGLRESSAVFAVLDGCDPGTIFEVGWAVRHGIPVVALSQNPKSADQTMILGSPLCSVSDDFASAIYRSAWAAWTK